MNTPEDMFSKESLVGMYIAGENVALTSAYIKGMIDGAWYFKLISGKERDAYILLNSEVREMFKHQDNDE